MTLFEHVAATRKRFVSAGISPDEAALDARILAQKVLGWDAARLHTDGTQPAPPGFAEAFEALAARRAAREPIAYLTGIREFWNLDFEVSPAVLIPRPETEFIVEAVLDLFPGTKAPLAMCDAGTGSGCLAISIAKERPEARITATDISLAALEVARRNAARHGVADRIEFVEADLLGNAGPFDLLVSNPPYVPEDERSAVPPEVREYEPSAALFGGPDGLDVIRRLVAAAPAALSAGGWLLFEIGAGQAGPVRSLISSVAGLTMTEFRRDLQGIERTAVVRRT